MLNTIIGNEEFKQSLLLALSGGRLSHSILIIGESGFGANYAARCLAADYLYKDNEAQANAVLRGESAECVVLSGEGASGEIKIDAVRRMRREIYNTALSANGRCFLLRNTQSLNAHSANALLKVLEEPPENVLFILTAPSEAAVLPTILSRCAVYKLGSAGVMQCEAYLIKLGADKVLARLQSELFDGVIGLAKKAFENEDEAAALTTAQKLFDVWQKNDELAFGAILTNYEKDRQAVLRLLNYLRLIFASAMRKADARAAAALPVLQITVQQINRNANTRLALACMCGELCEL